MNIDHAGQLPDPSSVRDLDQLVEAMRALRLWAGQPPLRRLRQLGGTTTDRAGRQIDAMPEATTAYVLRGDRPPKAPFVRAFVTACLRAAGRPVSAEQLTLWHQAWLAAVSDPDHDPDPATGTDPPASAGDDTSMPTPRQLPATPRVFVGRESSLAVLDALLPSRDGQPARSQICVIEGSAGVGKTALAIYWAQRARDRFPGGQLYLDLRGYAAGEPLAPAHALARLLRALGVAQQQVPADLAESAALYRSLLAERHTLVVLDNAVDARQVRPLLPGGGACLTLVTSRTALAGLTAHEGAHRITLDVLSPTASRRLLATLLGADVVAAEPVATTDLAAACAHLPLALRLAAAHITYHAPHRVSDYVAQLQAGNPLEGLQIPGEEVPAMPATFHLSYARLPPDSQQTFRRFALVPGPDLTVPAAAAITGGTESAARRDLDLLVAAHLLRQPAVGRYTCHDLLRSYALDRVRAEESPEQRRAVTDRLYAYYLVNAEAATRVLHPHALRLSQPIGDAAPDRAISFPQPEAALTWLDAERVNLVAVIADAAEIGSPVAWRLWGLLPTYFISGGYQAEGRTAAATAARAAAAAGDRPGQIVAQLSLAGLAENRGDYATALTLAARALALAREAGWAEAEAMAYRSLGVSYWQRGELRRAAACHRDAQRYYERLSSVNGQAQAANSLSVVYLDLGELESATEFAHQALHHYRQLGSAYGQASGLATLAQIHLDQGRLADADACFREAQQRFADLGQRDGVGNSLRGRAAVHREKGELITAETLASAALDSARDTGNQRLESYALITLASIQAGRDDPAAVATFEQGLQLARSIGSRYQEVVARIGLARALRSRSPSAGARHARQARDVARSVGYRRLAQQASDELAAARTAVATMPQDAMARLRQVP